MKYSVVVEKGRESGYVAICPALKGCVSQGRTKKEAIRNVKEAIEVYIEALMEDGLPIPTEAGMWQENKEKKVREQENKEKR